MPDTPESNDRPQTESAPATSFVSNDEFKRFEATLNGRFEQLATSLDAVLARTGSEPKRDTAPPPPSGPSSEELEEALATGKGADKFLSAMEARFQRFERDVVAPLRNLGLDSIARLTEQGTIATREHYTRFKKEIDTYVGQMAPALRTNPEALDLAYNAVIGKHAKELADEAVEAAMRSSRTAPPPDAPTRRNGRTFEPNKTPSPEELFGREAADELFNRYSDADTFARRMGYKGWDEYAAKAVKQQQGETAHA